MTNRIENKKKKSTDFILKDIFDPLKSPGASEASVPLVNEKEEILLDTATERFVQEPARLPKKSAAPISHAFILSGMTLAILALYFMAYQVWLPYELVYKQRELESKRRQFSSVQARVADQEKLAERLTKLIDTSKHQKEYLSQVAAVIKSIKRENKPFVQTLSSFSKIQSDGVWLERVTMQNGNLSLRGYVLDQVFLDWFLEALKNSKAYNDVSLQSSKPVFLRSGKIITLFEIHLAANA